MPSGPVTRTRLSTSAITIPASAMDQPVYTRGSRLRASSAQNAGRTSPAVTQPGGSPGPPGLSSGTDHGPSRGGQPGSLQAGLEEDR